MKPEQICFRAVRFDYDLNKIEGMGRSLRHQKLNALLNRFYRHSNTAPPTHIDQLPEMISALVNFLIEDISPNVSSETFRIYKKAVLPIIPFTDDYLRLNDTKGVDKRQLKNSTENIKQKYLTQEQLHKILKHNEKYRTSSAIAKVINNLLPSTVLTGLRPSEWYNAMIRQCAGRLTLLVRTDKLYEESHKNLKLSTSKDLSEFLPYRGIPLDHLDEFEINMIRTTVNIMGEINQSDRDNRAFTDTLAKNLRRTVKDTWSRENRPNIILYSARHQFIANLKASKTESDIITYLAGQIYSETKDKYYASKAKGEVITTPYKVEDIKDFVQREINSRFQDVAS